MVEMISTARRFGMAIVVVLSAAMAAGYPPAVASPITLPPVGGAPDYQLGAAYPPSPPVTIVARDRTAAPPEGTYAICYVNAFQTQPGEIGFWPPEVLLRDADGSLAHDSDWPQEVLLDTRTPQQRDAIRGVVNGWISDCADKGYDAVEFDNIDSYTRVDVLRRADAVALARDLTSSAHSVGLAAAQKNAAEDAPALRAAGFDFAVAEECAAYTNAPAIPVSTATTWWRSSTPTTSPSHSSRCARAPTTCLRQFCATATSSRHLSRGTTSSCAPEPDRPVNRPSSHR